MSTLNLESVDTCFPELQSTKLSPQTGSSTILVKLCGREGDEQQLEHSTLALGEYGGPK